MCFDDLCTWSYDKHKIPHCRNSSKIQAKNVERGAIRSPSTQIHDRPLSWLGADTSIKSGGVELVLWAKILEFWNAISIKHQIICTPNTVIFSFLFILCFDLICLVVIPISLFQSIVLSSTALQRHIAQYILSISAIKWRNSYMLFFLSIKIFN